MDTQNTYSQRPRRRWLAALLGLIIFLAGLVVGIAGTVAFTVHTLQYILHHPEHAPTQITNMLTRRLSLDDTQRQKVLAIVTNHQEKIQALRREMRPQFDDQLNQVRAEIDAVLNVDQRVKWDTMFDRLRDQWTPTLLPPTSEPSKE
jgi:Spy/CpxP family protein refolding chaperone